jgi:hypothetical protein
MTYLDERFTSQQRCLRQTVASSCSIIRQAHLFTYFFVSAVTSRRVTGPLDVEWQVWCAIQTDVLLFTLEILDVEKSKY